MKYLAIGAQMRELKKFIAASKIKKAVDVLKIYETTRPHSIGVLYKRQRGLRQPEITALLNSFAAQQQEKHPGVKLAEVKLIAKL